MTIRTHRRALVALAFSTVCIASANAFAVDRNVTPGQSIQSAVNAANPGDRILVHAGTYAGGGWIERSGTSSAPIQVISVDGPRLAVIEGGTEALRIGNSNWMIWDGFEVRNSGDNVAHIDSNSTHLTFRNMYFHDAGFNGDVFKVNQCDHITVEHSEFARPGARDPGVGNPYQECLDFVHVNDSVIRDNWFHDGGSMLMFVKGGSRNTVIERNTYSQQRPGASDPAVGLGGPTDLPLLQGEQYEIINVIFRNNVIMNAQVGAVAVYDANGAYVANNLMLNNNRVLVEFRAGNGPAGGSTDVRVVNNVFVDTRGSMPTPFMLSSHTLSSFSTTNNLFWNAGHSVPTGGYVDVTRQPGYLGVDPRVGVPDAAADRTGMISTSQPAAGSPAIGSGIDATGSPFFVTDDINGTARSLPMSRGPFALTSTVTPPPPPPVTDAGTTPPPPTMDAGTTPPPPVTDAGTTPPPAVTAVSFTANPTNGVVSEATVIHATSTGSATPVYQFTVVTPAGVRMNPCGGYAPSDTCTFTPDAAGTWQIAVSARAATSSAAYDARTGDVAYEVAMASAACPPEPTTPDASGQPRNAAGHIRYCWPGEAHCVCDADNDCYADANYVPCNGTPSTGSDASTGEVDASMPAPDSGTTEPGDAGTITHGGGDAGSNGRGDASPPDGGDPNANARGGCSAGPTGPNGSTPMNLALVFLALAAVRFSRRRDVR